MTPLYRPPRLGLVFVSVASVLTLGLPCAPALAHSPAPSTARHGAWLPTRAQLDAVGHTVRDFSPTQLANGAGAARSCEFTGARFTCTCVQLNTEWGRFRAERIEASRGQVRAEGIDAAVTAGASDPRRPGTRYFVARWTVDAARPSSLRLTDLIATSARHSMVLGADAARSSGPGGPLTLERLRWGALARKQTVGRCGWKRPGGVAKPVAVAQRAVFANDAWTIDHFSLAAWPPYLADFQARRPGPVSGFLPPTLVYSRKTASLQVAYLVGSWGIAPEAVVAPARWYGAGIGLTSDSRARPSGPPRLRAEGDLLDAQLRWSQQTDDLRASAIGAGVWGTPFAHLAADLEEAGDPAFWRTDRLGRDAFYRPWRLSQVGVSLSGPEHVFAVRAVHSQPFSPPNLDSADAAYGADLRLAVSHRVADYAVVDLEAAHTSFFDGSDSVHATLLRAGARHVFGSLGAAYLRPAVRGWLQSGIGSQAVGLASSTSGQILAMVDAGVALQGRFGEVTHRIVPALVVARAVTGFQRTTDGASAAGLPLPLAVQIPEWSLAGVSLDQRLDIGRAVSVEVPVGVFVQGAGVWQALDNDLLGLAGGRVRLGRPSDGFGGQVAANAACVGGCNRLLWQVGAAIWAGSLRLQYSASRLTAPWLSALQWRASLDDGWSFVEGFQRVLAEPASAPGTTHLAGLAWRANRWGVDARAFWAPAPDSVGLSLGNSYRFPELGWSVGVRADWRNRSNDWGVFVGLQTSTGTAG